MVGNWETQARLERGGGRVFQNDVEELEKSRLVLSQEDLPGVW